MSTNPRGDSVIRAGIVCGVFQTLAVCLRLLARWKIKASLAADDWLIVATLVPSYAMLVAGSLSMSADEGGFFAQFLIAVVVTIGGAGRHQKTLTNSEVIIFLKVRELTVAHALQQLSHLIHLQTLSCTFVTYSLTIAMAKISILLLYRRIFATKAFRKATLILVVACIMWAIAAICCVIFQCRPVSGAWTPTDLFTEKCIDLRTYFQCISGAHMGFDIIILCMPLHMIYKLELPAAQKLMVSGIFMLGGL